MTYHFIMLTVPIVFAIAAIFIPETPVYLIMKGKPDKALKAFQFLRGKDYDSSDESALIEEQLAGETGVGSGFWKTMATKASKKATVISLMLMFYQQFSGAAAVLFFLREIFTSAGSTLAPQLCTIITGAVEVIVSVFASWLMDKLGRRILLIVSCTVVSCSLAMLGLFFTLKNNALVDKDTVQTIGFLPILSLGLFVSGFCLGLGPIPWLIPSELFDPEVKAKCSSAAGTFNWLLMFLVTRCFLNVVNAVGSDVTFYIFSFITATGVLFVVFLVPETKGKVFLEIKRELEGKAKPQEEM